MTREDVVWARLRRWTETRGSPGGRWNLFRRTAWPGAARAPGSGIRSDGPCLPRPDGPVEEGTTWMFGGLAVFPACQRRLRWLAAAPRLLALDRAARRLPARRTSHSSSGTPRFPEGSPSGHVSCFAFLESLSLVRPRHAIPVSQGRGVAADHRRRSARTSTDASVRPQAVNTKVKIRFGVVGKKLKSPALGRTGLRSLGRSPFRPPSFAGNRPGRGVRGASSHARGGHSFSAKAGGDGYAAVPRRDDIPRPHGLFSAR